MPARRTRLLPPSVSAELSRLPWRLTALALIGLAICLWLALLTWRFADPSLNNATELAARNLLGSRGAKIADAMLQAFGLASVLLVTPIIAAGWSLFRGLLAFGLRMRLFWWTMAAALVPSAFACLPQPGGWPFVQGLGGSGGDLVVSLLKSIFPAVPPAAVWPVLGTSLALAGLISLVKASGIPWTRFSSGLQIKSPPSRASRDIFVPETREERVAFAMTRWIRGLSPRTKTLAKLPGHQREFWMAGPAPTRNETGGPAPRPEPPRNASKEKKLAKKVKGQTPSRSAASRSPFADWGQAPVENARDALDAFKPQQGSTDRESEGSARLEPFFGVTEHTTRGTAIDERPDHAPAGPLKRTTSRVAKALEAANARRSDPEGEVMLQPEALSRRAAFARTDDGPIVDFLPPLSLLASPAKPQGKLSPGDPLLMRQAATLMDVLNDFGVKGRLTGIHPGPVITLFELEPARGTKSSRVVGLADDIARSMSAAAVRVAPVPGRDAIGIELPNAKREMVSLRSLLEASAFANTEAALPLALGKSIAGVPIVVDLAKMPHLLIAGTTGSGKSVGINTMILSLLYRLPPLQCKFIMIDPKMLELSAYDGIPHLLTPVVTDPKKAVVALKWTVKEMTARYERMSKLGVRNVASYNAKAAGAALRGIPLTRTVEAGFDPETGERLHEEEIFDPAPMPYIVVVIDEMADLMMVAGKEIEVAVQRLSQMARAAGIHVIMATQRPSVDVVTGTIKANFPSRISFQVTSKIDSRTIIGEQGAEQLLGAGDMLYLSSGGRIVRAHGAFVSDGEVEAVTRHLRAQGAPVYRDDVLYDGDYAEDAEQARSGKDGASDIYDEAVRIVLKDKKPTASYLQRRLGIGYSRATSLIERMEEAGVVGAPNRSGRREILADPHP